MQRGMEIDLSDKTYDGQEQGDRFVNGLGQLVDGQRGKDNFRMDINGFGKGNVERIWLRLQSLNTWISVKLALEAKCRTSLATEYGKGRESKER